MFPPAHWSTQAAPHGELGLTPIAETERERKVKKIKALSVIPGGLWGNIILTLVLVRPGVLRHDGRFNYQQGVTIY